MRITRVAATTAACTCCMCIGMWVSTLITAKEPAHKTTEPTEKPTTAAEQAAVVVHPAVAVYADGKAELVTYPKFRIVMEVVPSKPMTAKAIIRSVDNLCSTVLAASTLKDIRPVMLVGAVTSGKQFKYERLGDPPTAAPEH